MKKNDRTFWVKRQSVLNKTSRRFLTDNISIIVWTGIYIEYIQKIKAVTFRVTAFYFCTGREARTPDTRFWRPMLYQLSYSRVCGCKGSTFFYIYKAFSKEKSSLFCLKYVTL